MNIKDLEIKYTPTFSNKPHIPEYDLIETFFDRVDYTEKQTGIYEFDFYDKEGDLYQFSLNLKNVYTDYRKWSERFLIYFVMMDKIVHSDTWILRRTINRSSLGLPDESIDQYIADLKKKAFQFLLDLALKEVKLINENNDHFFIEQIERGLRSYKNKDLSISLGLKDTCNFFINFLYSITWRILDPVVTYRNIRRNLQEGYLLETTTCIVVSFDNTEAKLQIGFSSSDNGTCDYILQDLEVLKEKGKFVPIFTDSSIYKEPEITKLGEYNILKDRDETIYLTGSFIIGPVDGYSLFDKSKLTVAGAEKILNISPSELKAKVEYVLMTK